MFKISQRRISTDDPPFIIAELSANHNGSIKRAKESISLAKKNGADAIKIQSYTPDTMTINSEKEDFIIKSGLWKGYKLFDLYKEAHTPFEWHEELFKHAHNEEIILFSSPFDESAVDLLEELNTPAYKVASFELCDLPLIEYIAKTKKPILMSTGMASIKEIEEAVETAKNNGCSDLLLFHCISAYPAALKDANLKNISYLKEKFNIEVGLSDHTFGNTAAIASISLGASAIEKHFCLSRALGGHDSQFSIEPFELKELKEISTKVWESLGSSKFGRSKVEMQNKVFKRSLYFVKSKNKGEFITKEDIKRIRPGFGISPKYENQIIGKILKKNVERGDPVKFEFLE